MIRPTLLLWLLLFVWLLPPFATAGQTTPIAAAPARLITAESPAPIAVAVLAYRGTQQALRRWQPTMDYLSRQIPGRTFRALPLSLTQIEQRVAEGRLDFLITNPGQYVRLGSQYGLSWLATLRSKRHPGQRDVIGSALLVKRDAPFQRLAELRDVRIGAVSPLAFGGFQAFWGTLAQQGLSPSRFFERIDFSEYPVDALIYWVRDAQVEAAIVPACLLEKMADEGLVEAGDFRVLEPITTAGFNCRHSSRLYPNWSFARLPHVSDVLAQQVSQALLEMPSQGTEARASDALGWGAPVSTYDIHQLYRELDIHPWQAPWWQGLFKLARTYWPWVLVLLSTVLLGAAHHLWVEFQVRRRTAELARLGQQLLDKQQALEHAQRISIMGEMASGMAHELNQPLTAIQSYCDGSLIRLENNSIDSFMVAVLGKIRERSQHAADIIQHMRGFARKQADPCQPIDLVALIRDCLELLERDLNERQIRVSLDLPQPLPAIPGQAVPLQQVLFNLLRNAQDALALTAQPRLSLRIEQLHDRLQLQIEDNGCGISEADQQQLFMPFFTTKQQGLGLGLVICRSIIEEHGGELLLDSSVGNGTRVLVTLPVKGCEPHD